MIRWAVSLLLLLSLSRASGQNTCEIKAPAIIPRPVTFKLLTGHFVIDKNTSLFINNEAQRPAADFLNNYLQKIYGFSLTITRNEDKKGIRLSTRTFIQAPENEERYTIHADRSSILIEGDSPSGTFYGIQTLIQLLPVKKSSSLSIPAVNIDDQPRFKYRGLHLDVSRHFAPVSYVKKYIDYIALHKMNYFHWHLTDDQGWRIAINKYPKLSKISAYRDGTIIGRYPGNGNDSIRYGGFYTHEEIKEVVAYAAKRFITIIPEIEMPGHADAALAAYPSLGCTGGPYQTKQTWGVFDEVFCAGNDSVFTFLEEVMDEVMTLFPSEYIHIGGDECPKKSWKSCPKCQRRMKDNNLNDEHALQSYFIQRIEKYINSKGRKIIGWDEILEGGLAPNAAVMSWRGEAGGIEAAKQNHTAIMTTASHVYFDYSQSKNEDSVTIGGYLPLQKVYSYEPLPKELTEQQQKKIWGAQANLWTEYMKNPAKIEYQLFPRLSALSEVLWSPKDLRDWSDFEKRLPTQFRRYELWGANFSEAYYDLKTAIQPAKDGNGIIWILSNDGKPGIIQYTVNTGMKHLKVYSQPIPIKTDATLGATLVINGKPTSWAWQKFRINKATGKKISLASGTSERYPGNGGVSGLVNGIQSSKGISSAEWLGSRNSTLEAVIDLGRPTAVSSVIIHALDHNGAEIYYPLKAEVLVSSNGKEFEKTASSGSINQETSSMGNFTINFSLQTTRYVKIILENHGKIEAGKAGAGRTSWLLIDEIQIQ